MADLNGKKSFEYDDEGQPGLLVFFQILLAQEVIMGLIVLAQGGSYLPGLEWLGTAAGVVATGFPLVVFAGLRLARRAGLVLSRLFLLLRPLYLIPFALLNCISRYDAVDPLHALGTQAAERQAVITGSVLVIVYILVFSVGWYLYLQHSARALEWFVAPSLPGRQAGKTGRTGTSELYD